MDRLGHRFFLLDGDAVRKGLCSDLGYSQEHRTENIRRVAELAKMFTDAGFHCLCAFISPLSTDRELARKIIGEDRFIEIYLNCSIETCECRDVKGNYKLARQGKIAGYTGITAPYETPRHPQVVLRTDVDDVEACISQLTDYLVSRGCLRQAASETPDAQTGR